MSASGLASVISVWYLTSSIITLRRAKTQILPVAAGQQPSLLS